MVRPHDRLEGAPERRDVTFTNGDFEIRVENTSAVENLSRVFFYKIFVFFYLQCSVTKFGDISPLFMSLNNF